MPLFACRWPNGDVSFVMAPNKEAAIEQLDELSNAEGCPVMVLPEFQIHLKLTDDGEFQFEEFGEVTDNFVMEILYPKLDKAWEVIGEEQEITNNPAVTPEQQERVRRAVQEERERVRRETVTQPQTEIGKDLKRELDMPTSLVNKIVAKGTRKRLKTFKPKGKPH